MKATKKNKFDIELLPINLHSFITYLKAINKMCEELYCMSRADSMVVIRLILNYVLNGEVPWDEVWEEILKD